MIAVSDSSPLILYAGIGRLDLLGRVFSEVSVPPAVWEEVVAEGAGRPGAVEVARMPWIRRRVLDHQGTALSLLSELGPGEAEAIALRLELGQPGPLLLDDRKGRRIARERGIAVVGSAGVLVVAKDRGLISAVHPLLDELRSAGLYLSGTAADELLAIAEERLPETGRG